MSAVLDSATEHQARARVALTAALEAGPSHAYLFRGPRGAGKRAAARALAAEILAAAAADPEDVRRRALLDPSPHPDLVWIAPRGAQHLVEEVRERVIRAASYKPFEGGKRVFVVEAAEALRDESQNALLKTLEEPPEFAHLILLSSEPEALLETVASRCQLVEFAPLPAAVLEAELAAAGGRGEEVAAAARLAAGDLERARLLLCRAGAGAAGRGRAGAGGGARRRGRGRPLEGAARARRGGRGGGRGGDPRGARGGGRGGHQAQRPRGRRGGQARRSPPPHRDSRPRPRALRRLAARPRRRRQRRRGGRLQPRPSRRAARAGRRARPGRGATRRGAGGADAPQPRPQRLRGASPGSALLPPRAAARLSRCALPRGPAGALFPAPAPGPAA